VRRRCMLAFATAFVAFAGLPVGAAAQAVSPVAATIATVTSGGVWGNAIEVPGSGALNVSGDAEVTAVSCASAGECSAGGVYGLKNPPNTCCFTSAFVVSQRHGIWGKAVQVPGLQKLNAFKIASLLSVSCASAGNCSAGGFYSPHEGGFQQAFVVSERNGTWGKAELVPGSASLNRDGRAEVTSVSCASAGNCAATGSYFGRGGLQPFVVSERSGIWGRARQLPGIAALNAQGDATGLSVSCGRAGDCAVGGYYLDRLKHLQGFVADERNGVWHEAIELPGLASLNRGVQAEVLSVSCPSAGECVAGGIYEPGFGATNGFVADERNGIWHKATKVPGLAALNVQGKAQVSAVSCASVGNCAVGGFYAAQVGGPGGFLLEGFVAVQRNGVWRKAIELRGLSPNRGEAQVNSVSCASVRSCAAGGFVGGKAFVVNMRNGIWGKVMEMPGTRRLSNKDAQVLAVSCAPDGHCAAGGFYLDSSSLSQAFVINRGAPGPS
jgi:hypothetical protein